MSGCAVCHDARLPDRLAAVCRWLTPSVVAACLGAVVAGVAEGLASGFGAIAAMASAGFAAMLAVPVCLAVALLLRGLWAAWRPRRLAPLLIEDNGGAPRLAAWILFLLVAVFLLSWSTFNGTRLIAATTTFKVEVVQIFLPAIVVGAALILAAVSRPLVDALAAGLRALDRKIGRRTFLAPRILFTGTLVAAAGLGTFSWFVSLKPRLGNLDAGIGLHPILALAITAAMHPIWRRIPARLRLRAVIAPTALATALIALAAVYLRARDPSMMLAIWSEPSIGGLAIDSVWDIDDLRGDATVQKYIPVERPGAPHNDILLINIDTVTWVHTFLL
jgi:hypothetical protein